MPHTIYHHRLSAHFLMLFQMVCSDLLSFFGREWGYAVCTVLRHVSYFDPHCYAAPEFCAQPQSWKKPLEEHNPFSYFFMTASPPPSLTWQKSSRSRPFLTFVLGRKITIRYRIFKVKWDWMHLFSSLQCEEWSFLCWLSWELIWVVLQPKRVKCCKIIT